MEESKAPYGVRPSAGHRLTLELGCSATRVHTPALVRQPRIAIMARASLVVGCAGWIPSA